MKITGVYVIKCKRNGFRYVGSSGRNIENRFAHHTALLNSGNHPCKRFQSDWDKYGPEQFLFLVLAKCTQEEALAEEQKLLDAGGRLYNIATFAASSKGTKRSEQTRAVMSQIAKERNSRPEYNQLIKERAKLQHANGKLGRAAWSSDVENKVAQAARVNAPKTSALFRSLWQDPAFRAKVAATRWTPERRAEQAQRIIARNQLRK